MKIKVDFAPENKECRTDVPGAYAIYRKKHWWNCWKVGKARYADKRIAISDARDFSTYFW